MPLALDVRTLPPPLLEFGGTGEFTDPKQGLAREGPFSLRFGAAHQTQVRLGLVGPRQMLGLARRWFDRCQGPIAAGQDNRAMYPDFPGFRQTFRSSLDLAARWQVELDEEELGRALALPPRERFQTVLSLYARGVERLADAEVRPDVTVCCLPEEVVRDCRSVANPILTAEERKWARQRQQARS